MHHGQTTSEMKSSFIVAVIQYPAVPVINFSTKKVIRVQFGNNEARPEWHLLKHKPLKMLKKASPLIN
jgi:hypothetical protein